MAREPDERVYGPPGYRGFVYSLGCVKVGCTTRDRPPNGRGGMQCCHVKTDGVSRKGPWRDNTYPGCWRCHLEQGGGGLLTFAARHELAVGGVPVESLEAAAIETTRQWDEYHEGLAW